MLDIIPEKFLITTRVKEASAPISIYSNKQMDTFFGCNLVGPDLSDNKSKKYAIGKLNYSQPRGMLGKTNLLGNKNAF